jgi:hypothetical protein
MKVATLRYELPAPPFCPDLLRPGLTKDAAQR